MTAITQSFGAKNQQGATLIVVLLVLLLIMIAGIMAVRQSRVDLQVATGDQINTVLLQTADNANQKLETIVNGDPNSPDYNILVADLDGLFGYFIGNQDRAGDEFIYCQTAANKDYRTATSTVRKAGGGTLYGRGYCGNNGNLTYTSSRNVVVGQVSVTPSPFDAQTNRPLSRLPVGRDINGLAVKRMMFDIRSTTAVPTYSNADTASIARCFVNSSIPNGNAPTVSSCLRGLDVPQTTVYQQTNVSQVTNIAMCVDFGKGEYSKDAKCQLP